MRSNKRYTNVTFTKRVDHEAGRHRPPRAPAEPITCERCHAEYRHRRWTGGEPVFANAPNPQSTHGRVLCPACRRTLSGPPCGYVRVTGGFLGAHKAEIEHLLHREEERAVEDNPTGRVMSWRMLKGPQLELTTTTPHLAQRLGHALEKAYGGRVCYDFSHENLVVRIAWSREAD